MVVRAPVQKVLEQLASEEEPVRDEGILEASALLGQEHSYASYEYLLARKSWLKEICEIGRNYRRSGCRCEN